MTKATESSSLTVKYSLRDIFCSEGKVRRVSIFSRLLLPVLAPTPLFKPARSLGDRHRRRLSSARFEEEVLGCDEHVFMLARLLRGIWSRLWDNFNRFAVKARTKAMALFNAAKVFFRKHPLVANCCIYGSLYVVNWNFWCDGFEFLIPPTNQRTC